jgi:hypothetical protein
MQDEEITLFNACTDLVTLKKYEAFLLRLLNDKGVGEWIGVRELCWQIGVADDELTAVLFATWLPDPKAQDGYVVIMFYDDESKWSMAAHYNRARLVGGALPSQVPQPNGTALPASGSITQQAAPATGGNISRRR